MLRPLPSVLQVLQGLPGPQITTSFCDASEVTTVVEPVLGGRVDDGARDVAPAPLGELTGGAPQAITTMHAIANEAGRSNNAGFGKNKL
ncbi:MAG: hypothetical protein WA215_07415 [Candidatus Cybelea sp.]